MRTPRAKKMSRMLLVGVLAMSAALAGCADNGGEENTNDGLNGGGGEVDDAPGQGIGDGGGLEDDSGGLGDDTTTTGG